MRASRDRNDRKEESTRDDPIVRISDNCDPLRPLRPLRPLPLRIPPLQPLQIWLSEMAGLSFSEQYLKIREGYQSKTNSRPNNISKIYNVLVDLDMCFYHLSN